MKSEVLRKTFIDFFKKKGHTFVPSAPVVPLDDPTLLFTNAGMNQFKDVFLGTGKREYTRAVNSQKCIRVSGKHNDLEVVGQDTYHHTFFEMLGNWSFGDYFKEEAILWAWELVTGEFGLKKEDLYVTVYKDDDESAKIWKKVTGFSDSKILKFDEKDNFWEMAEVGPCGPCTEIHIDRGESACDMKHVEGHVCCVNGGCARFIELWNLVFIQYNRNKEGKLELLKGKHVDTGAGFERLCAVLSGVLSNYDTDIFQPLIEEISRLTSKEYVSSSETGVAFRVIADHIRAVSFAIADGVLPENTGRGYVLRRLLRRASRFAKKLGIEKPFIYKLVPVLVRIMGNAFHEIKEKQDYVSSVIKSEEEGFIEALKRGTEIFEKEMSKLKSSTKKIFPGKTAFMLYDTYGFPYDLTEIMARDYGFRVDKDEFEKEMSAQKERARAAFSGYAFQEIEQKAEKAFGILNGFDFIGYERLKTDTFLVVVSDNKSEFLEKDEFYFVLKESPFYGESGGQVGDKGKVKGKEFIIEVINSVKTQAGKVILKGKLISGRILPMQQYACQAKVNIELRKSTQRNHTATHILHAVLRKLLGKHATQSGSFVGPFRFRFDFVHFSALNNELLERIEQEVNSVILEDYKVDVEYKLLSEALKEGVTALFDEKYGELVRVVKIDNISAELCGGCHVKRTGEIGLFKIISESAVAASIRRIEAITGLKALELVNKKFALIENISNTLKAPEPDLLKKCVEIVNENRKMKRELETLKARNLVKNLDIYFKNAEQVKDTYIVIPEVFDRMEEKVLRNLADELCNRGKSVICFIVATRKKKFNVILKCTRDLKGKFHAGKFLSKELVKFKVRGGGREDFACGGIEGTVNIKEFLNYVKNRLKEVLLCE